MADFLLLMHDDTALDPDPATWRPYLKRLATAAVFEGGSAIGAGIAYRKSGSAALITPGITGYIRVRARDAGAAARLIEGNPVYEAGGTVEIRALPREDGA